MVDQGRQHLNSNSGLGKGEGQGFPFSVPGGHLQQPLKMPHIKRLVEPTLVSRVPVDPAVRDELECMTNGTLANLIRDLSSLSKHAEDMFRELSKETLEVCQRATGLQRRIEDVHDKVTRLNPNMDVCELEHAKTTRPGN